MQTAPQALSAEQAKAILKEARQPSTRDWCLLLLTFRHRGEPILDEVLALRYWLRERVEDGSRILFPSQKGGAMTRMTFLRLFRKYALAVGVSRELAHPHILRHSLCSTKRLEVA
jgi:site-specific recombinase XerC